MSWILIEGILESERVSESPQVHEWVETSESWTESKLPRKSVIYKQIVRRMKEHFRISTIQLASLRKIAWKDITANSKMSLLWKKGILRSHTSLSL